MSEQNQRALILHWYVLLCCIRYTGMYMYPDLTTIHRYLCLQFFVPATYTGKYQSVLYLNVTGAGYLVPGTWYCSRRYRIPPPTWYLVPVPLLKRNRCMLHDSGLMVRQKHVAGTPGTWYLCMYRVTSRCKPTAPLHM